MSLAYKLWKIGNVLTKEDIVKNIKTDAGFKEGVEPVYLNIDFSFEGDKITKVSLNKNSISMEKLFFTKKTGGAGTGIYYLYPNLSLQNEKPIKKIGQLKNTLQNSIACYCDEDKKQKVLNIIEYIDTGVSSFSSVFTQIKELPKYNYIIWFSIDGQSFYEQMPEVWENYYNNPFPKTETKLGFDVFSNKETEIGYKTDFKAFSYDQYHSSLEFRIDENLPLSKESARNIKYAWMYILKCLVFYYKGLQYVTIPNILNDNEEMLKIVLKILVEANKNLKGKKTILEKLRKEEKSLKREVETLRRNKLESALSQHKLEKVVDEMNKTDLGLMKELNEQSQTLDELIYSVTLDYIFINVNLTNLSFDLNGTIEDVIPSRMQKIVSKMSEYKIEDLVKLGARNRTKTYFQDYFNREELYFALNRGSAKNSNSINKERIFFAKLLLSDTKIKHSDLLQRFEYNRNFGYDKKKRLTQDGFQEWIQYPHSFIKDEENIIQFLTSINKIQEA